MRQRRGRTVSARILIVDDHPLFRFGLSGYLQSVAGHTVCGLAESSKEALEAIEQHSPTLVFVDIELADSSGLELVKRIKALHPELPCIVLSMKDEVVYGRRALQAGARGYLSKDQPLDSVIDAVEAVLRGRIHVSEELATAMLEPHRPGASPAGPVDVLSDRELEVLSLIARGQSTRQIADRLFISSKTVESHKESIKAKLGLRSATELVKAAVEWAATGS